ncbi:MAG: YfcE family phosphodiesterase [Bulleidia sp.]|nr:YfcE family phosphodiesterase [Bulleidia sp.]
MRKQIILVSDSHRQTDCLKTIKEMYPNAYAFLHAGDSELPNYMLEGYACVKGNCDMYQEYDSEKVIPVDHHKILLVHGHRDIGYGSLHGLVMHAKKEGCDIVCFGHTHVPYDEVVDGVYLLNPGSLSHNRDGSLPSYRILYIDGNDVKSELLRYKN